MPTAESTLTTYRFCSLADLRKAGSITRWVDEVKDEITAVYFKGTVHVWSSVCPHFGGEFHVDCKTGEMRCKWHDWCFGVEDGALTNRNLKVRLRRYDYIEENGFLVITAK